MRSCHEPELTATEAIYDAAPFPARWPAALPREPAEKLGIANETVRNVLKRVFSTVRGLVAFRVLLSNLGRWPGDFTGPCAC